MGSKTETKRIDDNVEVTSIESFRWMKSIYTTLVRMCRPIEPINVDRRGTKTTGYDKRISRYDKCSFGTDSGMVSK